ncbi:hypothetical protein FSP39_007052 [Pinctada imbricata]|uniref:medium-chain acyl-CoA ligase n=1 Tax=Pinctada imbricata TaxID=66713 RepID=A0AA89BQ41_PINIB|nr:hypothetical protein FSP39_007052 [Pinctada imbricata]
MFVFSSIRYLIRQTRYLPKQKVTSRTQQDIRLWRRTLFVSSSKPFTDYEEHRSLMKDAKVPEYFNFARDVIDRWARSEESGTKKPVPAFWWADDKGNELKWTFTELARLSKRFANVLVDQCGLKAGDIVIVILPKIPEWWVISIGTIRAGVVMSSGTTLLRPKDIKHRCTISKAKCIITDKTSIHNVQSVLDDCPSVETKVFVGERSETPYTYELKDGDVIWALSDTGWAKASYGCLFAPWLKGSCVFIYNTPVFQPLQTLQVLEKYRPTHFCAPPTAVRQMIKENIEDFPSLKDLFFISAGEPVNPEVIDVWKEKTGQRIYEGYGQSETVVLCGSFGCIPYKPGSMGKASPGIDLQVVNDEGNILPTGTEGNIAVRYKPYRPLGLFTRYVNDEERTKAAFVGDFYLTGDRGYMDEDGFFFFVGRADDVIISAGYRIGPFEVESALLEHPAVLESAVVSSPDPERGEIVKAFVILTQEYKSEDKTKLTKEIQDHVKSITAPYKYPRKIEFMEELPKTVSGKIRRVELRDKEWGRETSDLPPENAGQ